jgi:hypothetical protein
MHLLRRLMLHIPVIRKITLTTGNLSFIDVKSRRRRLYRFSYFVCLRRLLAVPGGANVSSMTQSGCNDKSSFVIPWKHFKIIYKTSANYLSLMIDITFIECRRSLFSQCRYIRHHARSSTPHPSLSFSVFPWKAAIIITATLHNNLPKNYCSTGLYTVENAYPTEVHLLKCTRDKCSFVGCLLSWNA